MPLANFVGGSRRRAPRR